MKSIKKRLFVIIMTMVLLLSIVVGGTYAYFTDSVSIVDNIITAGDIDVSAVLAHVSSEDVGDGMLAGVGAGGAIEIDNFAPTYSATYSLTVTNDGSLDAQYRIKVNSTSDSVDLPLVISYSDTIDGAYTEVNAGVTGELFTIDWEDIATSATDTLYIKIALDGSLGNSGELQNFAFDIVVEATQQGQDAIDAIDAPIAP